MNHLLRSLAVVVALAAAMPVMATETVIEPVATPAATPAGPVVPATDAPKPAAAPAAQVAEDKREPLKVPPGYKAKVVDGEIRFCRKDTPLGSRFPTEVCMTEAQYQDQERNRDSNRNALQDRQKSYSNHK